MAHVGKADPAAQHDRRHVTPQRRSEDDLSIPLDPLAVDGARTLLRLDAGTRSRLLLAFQHGAGNAALQRFAPLATPTFVQREDDPPAQGTVVADRPATVRIPWSQLSNWGVKPLALKPWTERELTAEGATVTAGFELENFWSGRLGRLPGLLRGLQLVPKLGAGVEIQTTDLGTGAVRPKVGVKLFQLSLQKMFQDVNVVGEISGTSGSASGGLGLEWSRRNLTIGLKGSMEGELGREDPGTHRSTWEFKPKGTLQLEWKFDP